MVAQEALIWPGNSYPLGATFDGVGTNFALFSEVAERVELCLFGERGAETRVPLHEVDACLARVPAGVSQTSGTATAHGPLHAKPRCITRQALLEGTQGHRGQCGGIRLFAYPFGHPKPAQRRGLRAARAPLW
jgi:hypothetical protein